ncbi:MAG: LytTR family DNA-binding domain-containing protein [Lachnospiraceae bacterium]|jgi:DNA-binding LytR/AlgR family response regulator|nr:LytTR family DNA-binding domain-containing protein [Lachnospiraceae bacterium]
MEIAVCDDNELFLREMGELLGAMSLVGNIYPFSSLDAFLFSIDQGRQYDAVLMDIEWNKKSTGIDAAEELYGLCPRAKVVYVTGHSQRFFQQVYLRPANLSGFLSKPIDPVLLEANIKKISDGLIFEDQPSLTLQLRGKPISQPLKDICYLESRLHYILIQTTGETLQTRGSLASFLDLLTPDFYQCHKSYIVNMRHIRRFRDTDILMKDGTPIPVSRTRYQRSRDAFFHFMGGNF